MLFIETLKFRKNPTPSALLAQLFYHSASERGLINMQTKE